MIFLSTYLPAITPALILLAIVFRRAGISLLHLLALILPPALWYVLSGIIGPPGTLANAFAEPFLLGVLVSVLQFAWFLPILWSTPATPARFYQALIAGLAVAVLFALFFPDVPE